MTVKDVTAIGGGPDDLAQVVRNLIEKCSVEESEYRTTTKLLRRYKRVLAWFVIWLAMACIAVAYGNGGPMLWAVLVYLIILPIVAIYILVSLKTIDGVEIAEPPIRLQPMGESAEYRPEQVESLFNYYWAIDKRNDRVSTIITIAGTIIGISTLALVAALAVLFLLGL